MKYKIRAMISQDWDRVAEIYKQGMESNKATFQTVVPIYEQWDEDHLQAGRIVATVADQVIGWAVFSPTSTRTVFKGVVELSIYIDNDYQGLGIGRKLIECAVQEAWVNDIWTVQSVIMADNVPSLELHKKCGFREVGYRERIGKDREGTWRDVILLEKRRVEN